MGGGVHAPEARNFRAPSVSTPKGVLDTFRAMEEMTIADLAGALKGIPRDAVILIETPQGVKRLRMIRGTRIAIRDGKIEQHDNYDRYAIILQPEG